MGLVTDEAGIQFRMLNRRKGPAVRSPRAQADSDLYGGVLLRYLEGCSNLTIIEGAAGEVLAKPSDGRQRVAGVVLEDGRRLRADAVVLAAGTFLHGLMHTGSEQVAGGRIGEAAALRLSASLTGLGLRLGRLKTGTPPRVARDSIDFARLREQAGDENPAPFSFMTDKIVQPQVCCWLSATNPRIHELIRANAHRAPLFSGQIESTGPRYCPSIETKIVRFPEKQSHQIFLEPEGRDSERVYVNGISTSLPRDVQREIVALVEGLERARIVQWGYAIEYDFVPPEQIDAALMTKCVHGLLLAGQVNGTSGYEEAAGQGIIAGINAVRSLQGADLVTVGRDEGYIGVMIDDLVTRGIEEPYRMFTSRAEHRMHLRYDNADTRLTPLGRRIGLVNDERWRRYEGRGQQLETLLTAMQHAKFDGRPVSEWLRRPEEDGGRFRGLEGVAELGADSEVWSRAVVAVKYSGYIRRQGRMIERFRELEQRVIPAGTDYSVIPHLRREAMERWTAVEPRSVGQAARVSGIHPTDVSVLLVYLSAQEL